MAIASLYALGVADLGCDTLFLLDAGLDISACSWQRGLHCCYGHLKSHRCRRRHHGERTSFLLVIVLCLATLGYVGVSLVGGGLLWFCGCRILGLGFTFCRTVEAWLVDAPNHQFERTEHILPWNSHQCTVLIRRWRRLQQHRAIPYVGALLLVV
jgi:hypothetical protein